MRIYHNIGDMSRDVKDVEKRKKGWLANTLITGAVVVGMMGLARLSPSIAWVIAASGLGALIVFFYWAGRLER